MKLYATLRRFIPDTELGDEVILKVNNDITVNDILNKFNISIEEAKIILVNGIHQSIEYNLKKMIS